MKLQEKIMAERLTDRRDRNLLPEELPKGAAA
jgi:NADH-quinone oxidoreductase subunit B